MDKDVFIQNQRKHDWFLTHKMRQTRLFVNEKKIVLVPKMIRTRTLVSNSREAWFCDNVSHLRNGLTLSKILY